MTKTSPLHFVRLSIPVLTTLIGLMSLSMAASASPEPKEICSQALKPRSMSAEADALSIKAIAEFYYFQFGVSFYRGVPADNFAKLAAQIVSKYELQKIKVDLGKIGLKKSDAMGALREGPARPRILKALRLVAVHLDAELGSHALTNRWVEKTIEGYETRVQKIEASKKLVIIPGSTKPTLVPTITAENAKPVEEPDVQLSENTLDPASVSAPKFTGYLRKLAANPEFIKTIQSLIPYSIPSASNPGARETLYTVDLGPKTLKVTFTAKAQDGQTEPVITIEGFQEVDRRESNYFLSDLVTANRLEPILHPLKSGRFIDLGNRVINDVMISNRVQLTAASREKISLKQVKEIINNLRNVEAKDAVLYKAYADYGGNIYRLNLKLFNDHMVLTDLYERAP